VLHPDDYTAAQAGAREVRAAGFLAIRYPSVRDQPEAICWAIFSPEAFSGPPTLSGNWLLRVTRAGVHCRTTTLPVQIFEFPAAQLLSAG
jgi:hypothetical protein